MLEKVSTLYNANVYRFNYRNGDYADISIPEMDGIVSAPVANCLLAVQYAATEIEFSGNLIVDCGCGEIRITFRNGNPVDLSTYGTPGMYIYGLDVLCRRVLSVQ